MMIPMTSTPPTTETLCMEREFRWFSEVLATRMDLYFERPSAVDDIGALVPPALTAGTSRYADLMLKHGFDLRERLALLLALLPHLRPRLLDVLFTRNSTYDREFTEFGGVSGSRHKGFLPTGETLCFVLAGDDLDGRAAVHGLFEPGHAFARHDLLYLDTVKDGEPALSGALRLSHAAGELLLHGAARPVRASARFPAERIRTALKWDDLVLSPATRMEIGEIQAWMAHGATLLDGWGLRHKLRPGCRCLFYGPPGTGKTMTACLLGKATGREVYRVDLSMVVSKYIGETEKNLARVFDHAEQRGWILFFDEADALFGRRTGVKDAQDRYANQEVAFLLQRIEVYDGIIILASNLKQNLDEAFTRRFEHIIHFPMPDAEARLEIWRKSIPPQAELEPEIDLRVLAKRYELSGGAMMNVLRHTALMALQRGGNVLQLEDLEEGVRREFLKEGRSI